MNKQRNTTGTFSTGTNNFPVNPTLFQNLSRATQITAVALLTLAFAVVIQVTTASVASASDTEYEVVEPECLADIPACTGDDDYLTFLPPDPTPAPMSVVIWETVDSNSIDATKYFGHFVCDESIGHVDGILCAHYNRPDPLFPPETHDSIHLDPHSTVGMCLADIPACTGDDDYPVFIPPHPTPAPDFSTYEEVIVDGFDPDTMIGERTIYVDGNHTVEVIAPAADQSTYELMDVNPSTYPLESLPCDRGYRLPPSATGLVDISTQQIMATCSAGSFELLQAHGFVAGSTTTNAFSAKDVRFDLTDSGTSLRPSYSQLGEGLTIVVSDSGVTPEVIRQMPTDKLTVLSCVDQIKRRSGQAIANSWAMGPQLATGTTYGDHGGSIVLHLHNMLPSAHIVSLDIGANGNHIAGIAGYTCASRLWSNSNPLGSSAGKQPLQPAVQALVNNIDFVNMSWGSLSTDTSTRSGSEHKISLFPGYQDHSKTFASGKANGVAFIAAAGNSALTATADQVALPASLENVYSVGALTTQEGKADFASFSNAAVQLSTGKGFCNSMDGVGTSVCTHGTSMASPSVVGVAATLSYLTGASPLQAVGALMSTRNNTYLDANRSTPTRAIQPVAAYETLTGQLQIRDFDLDGTPDTQDSHIADASNGTAGDKPDVINVSSIGLTCSGPYWSSKPVKAMNTDYVVGDWSSLKGASLALFHLKGTVNTAHPFTDNARIGLEYKGSIIGGYNPTQTGNFSQSGYCGGHLFYDRFTAANFEYFYRSDGRQAHLKLVAYDSFTKEVYQELHDFGWVSFRTNAADPVISLNPVTPPTQVSVPAVSFNADGQTGYTMATAKGRLIGFGDSAVNTTVDLKWGETVVDIESYPGNINSGWALTSTGNTIAYGTAPNLGAFNTAALNSWYNFGIATDTAERITSMSPTMTGNGLYGFTNIGRVLYLGDAAPISDTTGNTDLTFIPQLNSPVVDVKLTSSGNGLFMLASDGGIFTFGDAVFAGALPELPASQWAHETVVSLVPFNYPGANGYYIAAASGTGWTFGNIPQSRTVIQDVRELLGANALAKPIVNLTAAPSAEAPWGFLAVSSDGGIFTMQQGRFHGSLGGTPLSSSVVAVSPALG